MLYFPFAAENGCVEVVRKLFKAKLKSFICFWDDPKWVNISVKIPFVSESME